MISQMAFQRVSQPSHDHWSEVRRSTCGDLRSGLALPVQRTEAVSETGLAYVTSEPGLEGFGDYCFHIYWDTTEHGGPVMS